MKTEDTRKTIQALSNFASNVFVETLNPDDHPLHIRKSLLATSIQTMKTAIDLLQWLNPDNKFHVDLLQSSLKKMEELQNKLSYND